MKFKKIMNIAAVAFLAFGVGMHFWNSYNGWGIATAKTLHPEVWAQLNDDDGGTTGGGTTTNPNDPPTPTVPDYHIIAYNEERTTYEDEEKTTDYMGGMFLYGRNVC